MKRPSPGPSAHHDAVDRSSGGWLGSGSRVAATWSDLGLEPRGVASDAMWVQRLFLGDALDFWKGTFLEVLRSSSPAPRSVRVLPMFSDAGWTAPEIDGYARILGVPPAAMLSTAQLTKPTRKSYFSAFVHLDEDVFVDPDTGVATARPELSHVTASEVFAMLSVDNVVAVYQHRQHATRAVRRFRSNSDPGSIPGASTVTL